MIIEGASVAECWIKSLQAICERPGTELSPAIVNIRLDRKDIYQDIQSELEGDLNKFLNKAGQPSIETTANTIFPQSLANGGISVFDRFEKIWKHVKHCKKNRNGHYFRRLVAFADYAGEPVNQLKTILETYNGTSDRQPVHRRSALIATTFDPNIDHSPQPQRGFPCLQQVCFVPHPQDQTLSLNAIYAMQYLSDRAYGNYLGLIRLGQFMAREMGLEFVELNCIASVLELGKEMTKKHAGIIVEKYAKSEK